MAAAGYRTTRRVRGMYPLKRLGVFIGMLLLAGIACNAPPPPQPPPPGGSVLVQTDGQVSISREQWADGQWSSVSVGAVVGDNDLLDVQGGNAMLLCADMSVQEMADRLDTASCPRTTTPATFSYEGYQFRGRVRGYDGYQFRGRVRGMDADVPYILFPRQALILEERPLLRWHDTGATRYQVSLTANGQVIWETAVSGSEVRYPDDALPLEADTIYQLVVQDTDTLTSSLEDGTKGTGFRLAPAEERTVIAQQREAIASLDALDEAEQQLGVALALISRTTEEPPAFGYWGEAWLRLEMVAQTHDTPSVWRWQGDALWAMRLPTEAVQAYERARQQAEAQGNREEQAAALAGLWRVTDEQDYFDEALSLYEELGDTQQIEALQNTP